MNIIELAKQAGWEYAHNDSGFEPLWAFAKLVVAHERDAIMKSIEELRPAEDNPLLQNKPAAFWIKNFRQIVYARGEA
jgi:hypothetical protein